MIALLALPAAFAAARPRGADGRFEKRESSHFVLHQDVDIDESGGLRGSRRFEQQVLQELEVAYERLDAFLGLRPSRRIAVFIYDGEVFDARLGGRFRFQIAGFFNGAIHIRGATQLTVELGRVLHHELVHAAFHAAAPSLVLPAWLNEGVAEWFEARALSKRHLSAGELAYLSRALSSGAWLGLGTLSQPNFARLPAGGARLAYLQSYGMVEHLVRVYGERALRELCRDVVRGRDLERSLLRSVHRGVRELEADFQAEFS
ncbi:MAG: hypothetical protein JRH16_04395 [Deltaproteobacteria bacterium]|nr:hypothetical protein [Deltaproteobacteria bacterium]MBW2363056.1 hypothetical protein [Deltaproteobacteria bacterium]